jgi:hypothetical protein
MVMMIGSTIVFVLLALLATPSKAFEAANSLVASSPFELYLQPTFVELNLQSQTIAAQAVGGVLASVTSNLQDIDVVIQNVVHRPQHRRLNSNLNLPSTTLTFAVLGTFPNDTSGQRDYLNTLIQDTFSSNAGQASLLQSLKTSHEHFKDLINIRVSSPNALTTTAESDNTEGFLENLSVVDIVLVAVSVCVLLGVTYMVIVSHRANRREHRRVLQLFTKLTGLAISTDSNVFWPIGPDMSRRELNICVEYTTNPMEKFKKQCSDLLEENDTTKVILYTDSRFASEKYQKSIVDWMDVTGYHGDVILINGSLTKEEKFHRSRLFSKKDEGRTMVLPVAAEPCEGSDAPAVTSESIPVHNPYTNESSTSLPEGIAPDDPAFDSYSARILVATVDSISAGLNVDTVRNVTQTELPSSVPNLLQPAGRAGRYPGALPLHNRYTNYISLKGYVYLFRRLHLPVEDAKEDGATVADTAKIVGADEYRKQQLEELKQMNRLLAIPQECLHVRWEQLMGNPFIPPSPDTHYKPPCGTDCSFCRQEYKAMFRPISKSGTQKILSALFIGDVDSDGRAIPPISDRTMDGLVAAIQEYPRSRILLFGGRTTSEKKPEPVQVSKVLLLLLASDILTLAIKYDAGDRAKKNPIVVFALDMSNGIHLYVDEYWSCLPLQTE